MGSEKIVGKLGDFITLVSRKNKNLETTKLVGISSKKEFLPANEKLKYADPTQYFVVLNGQFAVDLINIVRVNKLPVALNKSGRVLLVSNVYKVFAVKQAHLKSEYLMLLFKSENIDLQSIFWAGSGVRGFLTWSNFCKLKICIPNLKIQERIVHKYQTVNQHVEIKKKINELLERKMTTCFHILFDNLQDYEMKTFGELFSISRGGMPPKSNRYLEELYFCRKGGIPFLQVRDVTTKEFKFVSDTTEQLTPEGFKRGMCQMVYPNCLILISSARSQHSLGKIYINSCNLAINSNFWALSNQLTRGGASI